MKLYAILFGLLALYCLYLFAGAEKVIENVPTVSIPSELQ